MAQAKRRRVLLIVLLAVGIPLGVVVLLAVLGGVFVLSGKPQPVTAADRAVVVTIQDLARHMHDFEPVASGETFKKTRYLDGSHQLEYEYKSPREPPLYLRSSLSVEHSANDAVTNYGGMRIGAKVGFALSGKDKITQVDRDDLLRWGDDSHCTLLQSGGKPVGNLFVARKGERVVSVILAGVYFEKPAAFQELMLPILGRALTYNPAR